MTATDKNCRVESKHDMDSQADSGRGFESTSAPSFDNICVALTRAKMARAATISKGGVPTLAALDEEMSLVGNALQACEADEARIVLSEFWDEVDESLVSALGVTDTKDDFFDKCLPPGSLTEWKGAGAEARIAAQAITGKPGWSMPWPVSECVAARPLPTPCRSDSQQKLPHKPPEKPLLRGGEQADRASSENLQIKGRDQPEVAPPDRSGSFRTASELVGRKPPSPEERRSDKNDTDFDAVSRSIVGKKNSANSGTHKTSTTSRSAQNDGQGREWSDDWLRIADADQLEKIVPALEATIHRATGNDALTRNDIAGLEFVKSQIEEVLILPQLHPELFASALTRPARGLLLFGPPGTGKTLLARWIASECGATFFNVNASSVLSKWIGEAEKTVKALFQLAAERQPSVIFIDEIDSLLSQRRDADNESSRRVKNEFLTSLEGADTASEEKVLLVGATNMPWEVDHAALRRLPKRLYVPLPGRGARQALLERQLTKHNEKTKLASVLGPSDIGAVAARTEGYSGSDLQTLLREAAMGPVREATAACRNFRKRMEPGASTPVAAPRNINMQDFEYALRMVKPGFNSDQAAKHKEFNEEHGTCRGEDVMHDSEESTEATNL